MNRPKLNHEQSHADIFNDHMREQARKNKCAFYPFSLDGQDCNAAGDYLLTTDSKFALVEFKSGEKDLPSEHDKPKRVTLCKKLASHKEMRLRHDKCHFVLWADSKGALEANVYRHEICIQSAGHRVKASQFAEEFFTTGKRTLTLSEFQSYLAWVLTETSGSSSSILELVAHDPKSKVLAVVPLSSLAEAQEWVRKNLMPKSKARSKPPARRLGR